MIRRLAQLAAVAALFLAACGPAAPPSDSTRTASSPKATATPRVMVTPVPFEKVLPGGRAEPGAMAVAVSLWGHPETTERDLQLAKDAGFTWVKVRFEWRYMEPAKRSRHS